MPAERRGAITGASVTTSSSSNKNANNTVNNPTSNMSSGFSFGASSTPAPAFGAPAPAASGGFSFGAPAAAPAPAGGAFSFGAKPAASPAPAFGAAPAAGAPAPTTGLFGTPAPAPVPGGLFGTPTTTSLFGAPTPAPAGGSLFGTPAPAPGGSLFGAPAPAPGGSIFGAPAPAPGGSIFGAPAPGGSIFGQPTAATAPVAPPPALAGHMKYSELPPDQKQAIDRLYQVMMQHKRTVLQVSTMTPKLLEKNTRQADAAAGQDLPLGATVQHLSQQVHQLQRSLEALREGAEHTRILYDRSTTQAVMYARWPTEAVAARRGVHLTKRKAESSDADVQVKLQALLDQEMVHVDRVERMPSPYLWQALEEMEQRLGGLKLQMDSFKKTLEQSKQIKTEQVNVTDIVKQHEMVIWKIANGIAALHSRVDELRRAYRLSERGTNVLEEADRQEKEREHQLQQKLLSQMVKTLPTKAPAAPAPGGLFGTAPAPGGSIFGTPAPAPGGGLFGTPAPSTGGLFGATPAPAPGGLFGSTPAPSTGLFGAAPAPAPGGLFGAPAAPAPGAPAPAPGGLFGAAPAPAAGGIFGSTPAPAPGAFGATPAPGAFGAAPAPGAFGAAPAPAPSGGLFGSTTTSSTVSTPKSKNKSRSSRRR